MIAQLNACHLARNTYLIGLPSRGVRNCGQKHTQQATSGICSRSSSTTAAAGPPRRAGHAEYINGLGALLRNNQLPQAVALLESCLESHTRVHGVATGELLDGKCAAERFQGPEQQFLGLMVMLLSVCIKLRDCMRQLSGLVSQIAGLHGSSALPTTNSDLPARKQYGVSVLQKALHSAAIVITINCYCSRAHIQNHHTCASSTLSVQPFYHHSLVLSCPVLNCHGTPLLLYICAVCMHACVLAALCASGQHSTVWPLVGRITAAKGRLPLRVLHRLIKAAGQVGPFLQDASYCNTKCALGFILYWW